LPPGAPYETNAEPQPPANPPDNQEKQSKKKGFFGKLFGVFK
jgi:hypothetical protein